MSWVFVAAFAAAFAVASAAADPPSGRADAKIVVANVPEMKLAPGRHAVEAVPPKNDTKDNQGPIAATIVVDKPARNLRAYDRQESFSPSIRHRSGARKSRRRAATSWSGVSIGVPPTVTIQSLRGKR